MREEKTKYYVIKEKAVPEVLLKVIEAKRLMDMQELTVQQATEKAGISRSSFYKYKDYGFAHLDLDDYEKLFLLQSI